MKRDLKKLSKAVNAAIGSKYSNFYRKKYGRVKIKSWKDFFDLPFTTRGDLLSVLPKKRCFVPLSKARLIKHTSFTSGKKPLITFSSNWGTKRTARQDPKSYEYLRGAKTILFLCGSYAVPRNTDVFDSLGLFTVPGVSRNLEFSAKLARKVRADALLLTPKQAVAFYPYLKKYYDPKRIRALRLGSDVLNRLQAKSIRRYYPNAKWSLQYSSTEADFAAGIKCKYLEKRNPNFYHFSQEFFYEVVDRNSEIKIKDGEIGELVLTSLKKRPLALIRYRTEDLVRFHHTKGQCRCGRQNKYFEMFGQIQHSVVSLGGPDFFRDELEKVLLPYARFLTGNFRIEIFKKNGRNVVQILLEKEEKTPKNLKRKIEHVVKILIGNVTALGVFLVRPLPLGTREKVYFVDSRV